MARHYDPLDCIPSPDVVREKSTETERLAERLRILLNVSESTPKACASPTAARDLQAVSA